MYLSLSLLGLLTSTLADITCYSQTGTKQDDNIKPCNVTKFPNACCGVDDLCTENGLCLRQDGIANGFWYQDACTNTNWDGCPTMCSGIRDGAWEILSCDGGESPPTWCCRPAKSTKDCCSNSTAVVTTDLGKIAIPTVTISGTSTSTGSRHSPATITVTSTPNSTDENSSTSCGASETCSNKSAIATGAGVGASLGAMLLASIAVLIWRERTRPNPQPATSKEFTQIAELSSLGSERPPEIGPSNPIFEIEAGVPKGKHQNQGYYYR